MTGEPLLQSLAFLPGGHTSTWPIPTVPSWQSLNPVVRARHGWLGLGESPPPPRAQGDHVAEPGLGEACSQHCRCWCRAQDPRPCCGCVPITAAPSTVSTLSREEAVASQGRQLGEQKTNKKRVSRKPGTRGPANLNSGLNTFLGRRKKGQGGHSPWSDAGRPTASQGDSPEKGRGSMAGSPYSQVRASKMILQEGSHHV